MSLTLPGRGLRWSANAPATRCFKPVLSLCFLSVQSNVSSPSRR